MKLKFNGKDLEVNNIETLTDLVKDKKLNPESIAISYNNAIIPRKDWERVELKEHDVIDIVMFMMGG
ncbi:MAG: sulfur carrier protein ThiS [PVC group bacterium]|nr:sulfur carrier protein ThiS [PVC group bacterium]